MRFGTKRKKENDTNGFVVIVVGVWLCAKRINAKNGAGDKKSPKFHYT